jgi:F-type H+-transporting ATPase subunit epsilon
MLSTFTTVGSIGILANHAPLLAMLEPTELRLYRSESEIVRFAQAEGYLQVGDNHAMLLVEEAHDPSALDAEELRERLAVAERELRGGRRGQREAARRAARQGAAGGVPADRRGVSG